MTFAVRAYVPEMDEAFVYATWLRGMYYGNEFYNQIEQNAFFNNYKRVLAVVLAKPDTEIRIACLADEPDVILGFVCLTGSTLHFAFVKEAFRKQGLATQLIADRAITHVTHITKPGNAIRKKRRWAFNPFLF